MSLVRPFVFGSISIFASLAVAAPPAPPAPAPAAPSCKWADGADPAAPKDDPGRGVADWSQHQQHVLVGAGLTNAHTFVGARMDVLKTCLDKDGYARLYADLSVLVAHYGRTYGGWVDAVDPSAPKDDPGRGIGKWAPHRDHVTIGVGYGNANKLISDRMLALSTKIPKDAYARLYADASILLANVARGAGK